MNVHGIDHIEFYVGDAKQSAFYFCTAFGFRLLGETSPAVAGHRSLLLQQGGIRLVLTSALTDDHPAADYVRRHGDGVAVIAFVTPDARAAHGTAVRRGAVSLAGPTVHENGAARVVTADVAGFGDVVHRFVERHGAEQEFLPGTVDLLAPDPEESEERLTLVDHIAVCLPAGELDATVGHYTEVFGFRQIFEELIEVGAQAMDSKVVQSPGGEITFTLIQPVPGRQPGQIDDFLARHGGAGVQHLALLTHDIVGTVTALQDRGVRFLSTPAAYYRGLRERMGRTEVAVDAIEETNVLVDRDHWGELFQIFTQSEHVRRTYFTEIIDRHGARTFGSGNIKALYEAVEREKTPTS
ncbi:4-hydroxyphenylpyruvate dioxygenase [Streptomyces sp. NPDC047000]|uniref:4-hydroxyphenylpyruvate dioxygenase n=1 Tax=Streptomyces sp. NPDC047000 TaxID=3155474 RepID=UPI00340FDA99